MTPRRAEAGDHWSPNDALVPSWTQGDVAALQARVRRIAAAAVPQPCQGANDCTARARFRITSEGGGSWLACGPCAMHWRLRLGRYRVVAL